MQLPPKPTMESRKEMWDRSQQALQLAFHTGEIPKLHSGADRVWCFIGTNHGRFIFAVDDLGDSAMKENSVLAIVEEGGKLPYDIIMTGVQEEEEALYIGDLLVGP